MSVTEHKDAVMAGMVKQTEGGRLAFGLVGCLAGCDVCGQAGCDVCGQAGCDVCGQVILKYRIF